MHPNRVLRISAILALAAPLSLSAQTYNPHSIVFTGASEDKAALTALAGITPGKPVTAAEIDAAMQRLADTGLYSDMSYTVDDRSLTFTLKPQPDALLLPAVYGNFVLWKPEELTAMVHTRVPLFTGRIPTTGNLQQAVQDALTAILRERGIQGSVGSILTKEKTVDFSISLPHVLIQQVHADGVSPAASGPVNDMLQSFASTEYDHGSAIAIQNRLLDTYHDLGFLDVAVEMPRYSQPVVGPTDILVNFSATVQEGELYRISKLSWPTSAIVSQADFDHAAQFKPGDVAARILLLSTTARFKSEFERRGYLDARVMVQADKDSASHTIAYTFSAEPGEIYHLKSVQTAGLNDQQKKDFEKAWKLAPGAVYDPAYVASFSRNSSPSSLRGYAAQSRVNLNRADHTVDLVIAFKPSGAVPH